MGGKGHTYAHAHSHLPRGTARPVGVQLFRGAAPCPVGGLREGHPGAPRGLCRSPRAQRAGPLGQKAADTSWTRNKQLRAQSRDPANLRSLGAGGPANNCSCFSRRSPGPRGGWRRNGGRASAASGLTPKASGVPASKLESGRGCCSSSPLRVAWGPVSSAEAQARPTLPDHS